MKTDALIDLLAREAGPAPRVSAFLRLAPTLLIGSVLGGLGAMSHYERVPDDTLLDPLWWMKVAYAVILAVCLAMLAWWLGRPGRDTRKLERLCLGVVVGMLALGVVDVVTAPADELADRWLGNSWGDCSVTILLLSLPTLALMLWALHRLAPTRPRWAGFAAGAAAGATGAIGYSLACSEVAPSFVATWYTLGIVLAGALGAWIAPRWWRW